ncbi:hypothetical protein QO016_002106 [Methylobacterium persicinum]|uniref:Uncharacterized protein n=1 Tax=Methylobacterium persicinum TaxID=374426 RepID=A0ABU0HJW0_9HYPH|nr:hypothetical protein [Methylobacterium persicinum]GJE37818.1 hypothetical protein KHHGKMAE_1880 [Methylobacterium persicinum]
MTLLLPTLTILMSYPILLALCAAGEGVAVFKE